MFSLRIGPEDCKMDSIRLPLNCLKKKSEPAGNQYPVDPQHHYLKECQASSSPLILIQVHHPHHLENVDGATCRFHHLSQLWVQAHYKRCQTLIRKRWLGECSARSWLGGGTARSWLVSGGTARSWLVSGGTARSWLVSGGSTRSWLVGGGAARSWISVNPSRRFAVRKKKLKKNVTCLLETYTKGKENEMRTC